MHGLIQAFSRTNRILNSVKSYGNIICFRDLEENTNEAIGLYGDKEAAGIVLMKSFDDYYYGYHDGKKDFPGYASLIEELTNTYPLPLQTMLYGETMQKHFVRLFGSILKLKNILQSFEEFQDKKILTEGEFQNYQSYYLELYDRYRPERNGEREVINDDLVFEMELVKSVEINIDYILMLVAKYHESNQDDYEILATIYSAVDSSPELRNKKDLIEAFINRINVDSDVQDEWKEYIKEKKEEELKEIIAAENLKEDLTRRFIDNSFKNGAIKEVGTDIVNILPPTPLFGSAGNQAEKKARVLELLRRFFERFYGI
jgi:type I restriction enzyme R subunit